jgi:hypothetical protein
MATFPTLQSGAVTQYPLPMAQGQQVGVIRFLDGNDQRYLLQGRTFRRWEISLSLLTDSEASGLEAFFAQQQGSYSTFIFPDPISGTQVPNCRFGNPSLASTYEGLNTNSVSLWVIETNG